MLVPVREDDVKLLRAVNADDQRQFDVGGAAGAGNQGYSAAQLAAVRRQERELIIEAANDLPRLQDGDVNGRQQRRRARLVFLCQQTERAAIGERIINRRNTDGGFGGFIDECRFIGALRVSDELNVQFGETFWQAELLKPGRMPADSLLCLHNGSDVSNALANHLRICGNREMSADAQERRLELLDQLCSL